MREGEWEWGSDFSQFRMLTSTLSPWIGMVPYHYPHLCLQSSGLVQSIWRLKMNSPVWDLWGGGDCLAELLGRRVWQLCFSYRLLLVSPVFRPTSARTFRGTQCPQLLTLSVISQYYQPASCHLLLLITDSQVSLSTHLPLSRMLLPPLSVVSFIIRFQWVYIFVFLFCHFDGI